MITSQTLGVILVVEDEGLVRNQIANALRYAGWVVLEAHSAEKAIGFLQSGRSIDVVFTDIQLAGVLSGWDVAEQGRAAQVAMPVIYTSGNSADRSRMVRDCLFFEKPYNIVKVVDACCRLRQQKTNET